MKKIKIFVCLFLLISSFINAQNISVTYKETMVKNPIDTSNIDPGDYKMVMFKEMEKVKNAVKNVSYSLKANQTECLFEVFNFMENDGNKSLENAILASSADGKFYSNKLDQLYFWQVNNGSKYYRILNTDKIEGWKITKQSKKIGKYICYKATNKILLNNKLPIEVIAWFTPEVPYSFGPKGYGGLPGLIIALNERGFYFYAEKIKFHDSKLNIDKPQKGKLVTPDEYDDQTQIGF
ncbi:GLPGLI family protein [Mesonia aestuariivivens]|uniref:GLPGLI family protein n=1 Tax=Mesonia aestuariivivens TaxID=2796128 RepID=A0ABS6W215_9FLAO|nr:GLPGLI family protein [Mesonia aestuariivivens]MBW2961592.1 GLPGLI family protein [Mesonia aestuariivivens]